MSSDHFEAFFTRSPLQEYRVDRVVRLDRRNPNAPAEQGTPEWDVVVHMTYPYGVVEESFGVQGAVLGRVLVQPVALDLRVDGRAGETEISVDGVPVHLEDAAVGVEGSTWRLIVLNGRHELAVGSTRIAFRAHPLRIVDGPGRVLGDPDSAKPQTIVVPA